MKKTILLNFLFMILPLSALAGTDTLADIASSPTLVPATSAQYNAITNALQGHQVMRETDGSVVDNTYDIGRPSSGRPRKIYVGSGGLNVDGNDIDFDPISLGTNGLISGQSTASGYPDYVAPLGVSTAATNYFTVEGSGTNLVMLIEGETFTLETDVKSDDLTLAYATGNTCAVNSAVFADGEWTKYTGEYGYRISVDTIGASISAEADKLRAFQVGSEIFIGKFKTTSVVDPDNTITPIMRGVCGTDRETIADDDVITMLAMHFAFLKSDLATIHTTMNEPVWDYSAPSAPETGDMWFDSGNDKWQKYSGAAWEDYPCVYLGYVICDDSDCLYTEMENYRIKAWNDELTYSKLTRDWTTGSDYITIHGPFKTNVAGTEIRIDSNTTLYATTGYKTWNYIYVDNAGNFSISAIAPRKPDYKKGYYHPYENYRCVGTYYRDNYGQDHVYYDPQSNIISLSLSDGYDFPTYGKTNAGFVYLNIPPMASNVTINTFGERATAGERYLYINPGQDGYKVTNTAKFPILISNGSGDLESESTNIFMDGGIFILGALSGDKGYALADWDTLSITATSAIIDF